MNTEHFGRLLRDKEQELQSGLAELESEARAAGESEVRDTTDDATSSEETSESLEEGAVVSETLEQVRDALHSGRQPAPQSHGRQIIEKTICR